MASEIGKAYVQIIPSSQGIKGKLESAIGGGGEADSAGKNIGGKLVGAIKGAVAVAAIGKFIGDSVKQGAELEQSIGGVETLFKDSAEKIKKNASQAFKTAGVDANTYMQTVTSYAAGLVTSCAGDTDKAADVADMAMTDMSDNANKMGTSMESIQTAYNGFAKQNYTMLDNLKLGYGGTKSEMERLLSDAQKITGVKYDINNLSDVYSAIHVIQGELGITGTTANEAATTVSGSFGMLKASFTDLMGNLALGQNVGQSLQNVITSAGTFMANLIPMVVNIVVSIPQAIAGALPSLLPALQQTGQTILENITGGTTMSLPQFLDSAVNMITQFANKIFENIPTVVTVIGNMISKMVSYIMQNLPTILSAGVQIIGNIAKGLIQNLPAIVGAMANMFVKIVSTIGKNLPTMLAKGGELIGKIVAGIIKAIPTIVSSMPKVIKAVTTAFTSVDWATMGKNIIQGIINGITAAAGQIGKAMTDVAKSALESAKKALGIHSPSRVMAKEVGQYIPEGIAMGIDNGLGSITDAMNSATEATTKSFAPSFGTSGSTNVGGITMNIYGAEGQDINALADIIETRLSNSINRREAVYA